VTQATRNNFVVLAILAVVIAAAMVLVYIPQQRELTRLRKATSQEKVRMSENASLCAAVPAMIRQVQDLKKCYSNFDQRLPKQIELGGFLREISGDLSQESLVNHLIEPGSPRRSDLFHTLPITLRFRGTYLSLVSFLKRLSEMERLTQVERITISNKGEAPKPGAPWSLDIELLMNIYFTES
jgi:Tfp pilus assembly protein PilO